MKRIRKSPRKIIGRSKKTLKKIEEQIRNIFININCAAHHTQVESGRLDLQTQSCIWGFWHWEKNEGTNSLGNIFEKASRK